MTLEHRTTTLSLYLLFTVLLSLFLSSVSLLPSTYIRYLSQEVSKDLRDESNCYPNKSDLQKVIRHRHPRRKLFPPLLAAQEKSQDKEMIKAKRALEKIEQKKAAKTVRKAERRQAFTDRNSATMQDHGKAVTSSATATRGPKANSNSDYDEFLDGVANEHPSNQQKTNFAQKTVLGKNIISCRDFNIDGAREFKFLGGFQDSAGAPIYGVPEIAFLGRSNVGKSSLLNCLTGLNKNIAVESKTPGRTRAINLFKCSDKIGDLCVFVDLPGYGFAKMSKTQQEEVARFLRDYLENRSVLRLAVLLIDVRREPQDGDLGMLQFLQREGLPHVIVATKCDKLTKAEESAALHKLRSDYDLPEGMPLPFSSVTGEGRKSLWRLIKDGILGKLDVDGFVEDDDEGFSDDEYDEDMDMDEFDEEEVASNSD